MKKKLLSVVSLLLLSFFSFSQTDRYWSGGSGSSNNIDQGANWFGGTNPSSNDNLYYNNTSGGRFISNSNYGAGSFFNFLISYSGAGPINFTGDNSYFRKIENNNNGSILTISNNTIGNRPNENIEINPVGSGGLALTGSTFTLDCNNAGNPQLRIYGNNSLSISNAIIQSNTSGGRTASFQIMSGSTPTVTLTGANTYTGLTTINGGTLRLNHTGGTTLPTTNNITVAGGTLRVSTTQTIADLNLSGGGNLYIDAGATLTVTGTYTPGGGAINNQGTLVINGTNALSFPGTTASVDYMNNLTISNGSTVTLNNNLDIQGTLTLTSGTFAVAGFSLRLFGPTIAGTAANLATTASSSLTFAGSTGGSLTLPSSVANLNDLTIQNSNTATVTMNGSLTIAGTLTFSSTSTLAVGSNTLTLNGGAISGTASNLSTTSSSNLSFGGTNAGPLSIPSSVTALNSLTINNTNGTPATVNLNSNLTVSNTLALTRGKLAIGSNTLTLNGTVSGMDASNCLIGSTTSNLTIGGTGALGTLYFDQTSNATKTLNNIIINRTSTGTVSLGNSLRLVGELSPTAGVLTTGGNLRLLSSAIGTSAAIGIGSSLGGYISGTVDVERYSQAQRGYRTLAHPYTTAQTVSQLTDNFQITGLTSGPLGTYGLSTGAPSALYYDGTKPVGTTSVLGRITKSDTAAWGVGKGLYVFVRGNGSEGTGGSYVSSGGAPSPLTLDVTSANINQGDVTVTLSPYTIGGDNYTLVGNPYPCPINLSGVTNIGDFGNVYVYNPTLSVGATSILRGGFEQQEGKNIVIPSMGCFYIQSTAVTPATITFHESDKVASGTSTYAVFGTGAATSKIGLEISTSAGFMDRTKIVFTNNATSAATDFYDGGKLGNNLVTFYSISSERKALGIDYRKTSTADIIPLGIQTATATNYTISLSELTDLPNTQVVLRDKLLKTEKVLSQVGDSYSFDITADTATKGENRFEIGLLGTTVLPVQIADITAQLQTNKTVAVNWTSTTEVNLASYRVQRSKDGSNFSTVGTVAAKGASTYSYSDDLSAAGILPATIYYRLEALDKDGSKTYSKVVAVALGSSVAKAAINIYPNPVQSTLFAQVTVTKAGAAQLKVVDAQGKIVATQKTQLAVGTTSISIPAAQLAAGSYVLEIETTDGKQQQRFVKE